MSGVFDDFASKDTTEKTTTDKKQAEEISVDDLFSDEELDEISEKSSGSSSGTVAVNDEFSKDTVVERSAPKPIPKKEETIDPFAKKSVDPFAKKTVDPFAKKTVDPFSKKSETTATAKPLPTRNKSTAKTEQSSNKVVEYSENSENRTSLFNLNNSEFEFAEEGYDDNDLYNEGLTIYVTFGLKGSGKTRMALSIGGHKATFDCISLDRKTQSQAKYYRQTQAKDIRVIDARKYLDYSSPIEDLNSSEKTFRFIMASLDAFGQSGRPDYVLIDGVEELNRICEMTMRKRNGLMPYQGIQNKNVWKERRLYIKQIHDKACQLARKGVVYTTYIEKDDIIEQGEYVKREDVPRWVDVIMLETDVVIKCFTRVAKGNVDFMAQLMSDKTEQYCYNEVNVTGGGISMLLREPIAEGETA